MSKLITLNGLNDEEVLNDLFNDEIIVLEDIQGSKIWVNWDGAHFNIKPKSVSNESINLIDLAMQNYYNPAINYFNSLDGRIKSLLNKKWWFGAMYRYNESVGVNIAYQIKESFMFGYAYDFQINGLSRVSKMGSHEVMLSYDLNSKNKAYGSPRYF